MLHQPHQSAVELATSTTIGTFTSINQHDITENEKRQTGSERYTLQLSRLLNTGPILPCMNRTVAWHQLTWFWSCIIAGMCRTLKSSEICQQTKPSESKILGSRKQLYTELQWQKLAIDFGSTITTN